MCSSRCRAYPGLVCGLYAVQTRRSYALRYLLIAAAAAFGVTFFYLFPRLLGRPAPRYPTGDFHMIAMIEQADNVVEMWVATTDGSRLYRFTAEPALRKQLRTMTDGHGAGHLLVNGALHAAVFFLAERRGRAAPGTKAGPLTPAAEDTGQARPAPES